MSQHWVPPEAGSQTGLPMKSTKQRPVLHLPRPCMQTVIGSAFKELHRVHLPAVVAVSTTFIKAGKKKKTQRLETQLRGAGHLMCRLKNLILNDWHTWEKPGSAMAACTQHSRRGRLGDAGSLLASQPNPNRELRVSWETLSQRNKAENTEIFF